MKEYYGESFLALAQSSLDSENWVGRNDSKIEKLKTSIKTFIVHKSPG